MRAAGEMVAVLVIASVSRDERRYFRQLFADVCDVIYTEIFDGPNNVLLQASAPLLLILLGLGNIHFVAEHVAGQVRTVDVYKKFDIQQLAYSS